MKVSIWDTYVQRDNGSTMHFDIVVPSTLSDATIVYDYGRQFLKTKSFDTGALSSEECRFCHIEQATDVMVKAIEEQGFFIIEMENCK